MVKVKGNVIVCCCYDSLETQGEFPTPNFSAACYNNSFSVVPGLDPEASGTDQYRPTQSLITLFR